MLTLRRDHLSVSLAALLLTLGRVGGVGLADDGRWPCHQGLDEGLGSWFHLRNALRSGQSRVA